MAVIVQIGRSSVRLAIAHYSIAVEMFRLLLKCGFVIVRLCVNQIDCIKKIIAISESFFVMFVVASSLL